MANGTRLARLKMLEDDSIQHKSRKLDKLNAPSSSERKLETAGKKLPESPMRRSARMEKGGPSSYMNSRKTSSACMSKSRTGDERIGTTNSSYTNKSASPTAKKRKNDSKSISSNADNCFGSDSPQSKRRKVDDKKIILEENDKKSEDNGKKTVRKHLHVRAYKRMIAKHANKGSNHGTNICKETLDGGDKGSTKVSVQDDREPCDEAFWSSKKEELENTELHTTLSANSLVDASQECEAEFSVASDGQQIHNSNSGIVVDSSRKGITNHDCPEMNVELLCPTLEDPGLCGSRLSDGDSPITTNQRIADENVSLGTLEPTIDYQTAATFTHNLCLTCKQPGHLMCCCGRGCKQSFHLSCLHPPVNDVLPGAWFCTFCVKKKMELGVYSVSEGIESVWDVKEGVQSGKRYLVKYKGLGHVHNRWISESQLLDEASSLLAKFRKKNQREKVKWRKEWSQPERLLLKRSVIPPEDAIEHIPGSAPEPSSCWIEWLVKWRRLEYYQATWESESSLLSYSQEAASLIEDYERRRELARRSSDAMRANKALQSKKDPFCKLSEFPAGCSSELDSSHLTAINCLREFWHKSVNAVFIDDQERITRSVLFVLSLQSHSCRPILIITTTISLPLWQAEFAHLAPSLDVVMYQGDSNVRRMIQNLEFYEESGCLMLQLLLADSEAIVEDLSYMTSIVWDTIIVDKCQNWKVSGHLQQLKCLNAHFKILLLNGQPKDSLSEYRNLLSFISTVGVDDDWFGLNVDTNDAAGALAVAKGKLTFHIAYECKVESSKFLEYWVPVPFSNVQLEQYCASFVSNSSILRSNSKSEVVGALHCILINARKCCDHPYLVDGELRGLLTRGFQGTELLNAEVCLSGKLFLLDKILQEMKIRGLRVVILFQSLGGPGKISLGDILDDFLQQRFGVDSYERIETGLVMTKKLAALKMFNDKERGRFVFLIEKRACLPSVKLSSVDAVILFDSDWNPLNDLRSLQKMSIDSPHSHILVFRLHTSFTVEEKLLMLAKQDIFLDSAVQNISRSTTHSLLGWGASYLFQKLDQFHSSGRPTSFSEPLFDKFHLNDVISDIFSVFPGNDLTTRAVSVLIKAQQVGATYSRNIILMGEKEGISFSDKDLPNFWSGLLVGRHPRWIYISENSPRVRKKVQNFDGLMKTQQVKGSEVKKKHRKLSNLEHGVSLQSSQEPKDVHKAGMLESEGGTPKLKEQRNLLLLLSPELSKLGDVLGLSDPVKDMAQEFLVYIMNNHDVSSKQETVLQALMISLCWRAASMSKHSLKPIESLALAKKLLKFECTVEEALSVYSRLRILKEKFPCRAGELNLKVHSSLGNRSSLPREDKETPSSNTSHVRLIAGAHDGCKSSEQLISPQQGCGVILKNLHLDSGSVKNGVLENQVDLVEKVYLKRSEEITCIQQAEVSHFDKEMREEEVKLKKAHDLDLEFVRTIHCDSSVRQEKLNILIQEFSEKMHKFYRHLKEQKEKLSSMQLESRNKEQELRYNWLEKAKIGQLEKFFHNIPLIETGFKLEKFKESTDYAGVCIHSGTTSFNSLHPFAGIVIEDVRRPAGASSELEEDYHEVPSDILNETEGSIMLSDETLASGTVEKIATVVHAKLPMEPLVLPCAEGVLPMYAQVAISHSEVSPLRSEPANLVTDSIAVTAIGAGQLEGRGNLNAGHLIPNVVVNQAAFLLAEQGLASSVPASTSSSIQELCSNDHSKPAVAVASGNSQAMGPSPDIDVQETDSVVAPPHIELLLEHNQERPSPAVYNEVVCSESLFGAQCSGIPGEETFIGAIVENEPPNLQITENAMHPLRTHQELLSEIPSPTELRGGIQRASFIQSLSSAQRIEVSSQQIIAAAVVENEPSCQQTSEDAVHPLRLQEDIPSERTTSGDMLSYSVQPELESQVGQSFQLLGWVPPQAICADPFKNELFRICRQVEAYNKKHEDKKAQLHLECEQEIEKVRRKYDDLIQEGERAYVHDKKFLQRLYDKVYMHKVLAEELRTRFYDHKEAPSTSFQGSSQILSQQLQISHSQSQLQPRTSVVAPTVAHTTASLHLPPMATTMLNISRPRAPAPVSAPAVPSIGASSQTSSLFSAVTGRGSTPRANPQFGRAPAPHLLYLRSHTSNPSLSVPPTPANTQLPLPSMSASTLVPSGPSLDMCSTLPATFPSQQPSIFPACGNSQPTSSGPSPVNSLATQVELPHFGIDLLESLLSTFQSTENASPTSGVPTSELSNSQNVICLSDDE